MRQIRPDLWQTAGEHPLAALPETVAHAYLLTRPGGNLLVYAPGREAVGTPHIDATLERIAELGGVSQVLLCHWHEATPSLKAIKQRFGASIAAHARDAAPIERHGGVVPDHLFWDREVLPGEIEAIPTPGHTVGSACYLARSPQGATYLFTGDTIWQSKGTWRSVTFEDDAKQSNHRASLDLLGTLEPDLVMAAIGNPDTASEVAPGDWPAAIEAAKASLG